MVCLLPVGDTKETDRRKAQNKTTSGLWKGVQLNCSGFAVESSLHTHRGQRSHCNTQVSPKGSLSGPYWDFCLKGKNQFSSAPKVVFKELFRFQPDILPSVSDAVTLCRCDGALTQYQLSLSDRFETSLNWLRAGLVFRGFLLLLSVTVEPSLTPQLHRQQGKGSPCWPPRCQTVSKFLFQALQFYTSYLKDVLFYRI